jgi:hypothetical protein
VLERMFRNSTTHADIFIYIYICVCGGRQRTRELRVRVNECNRAKS